MGSLGMAALITVGTVAQVANNRVGKIYHCLRFPFLNVKRHQLFINLFIYTGLHAPNKFIELIEYLLQVQKYKSNLHWEQTPKSQFILLLTTSCKTGHKNDTNNFHTSAWI